MYMICMNVIFLFFSPQYFVIMKCLGREQEGRRGLFASGTNQIVLGGIPKHTAKRRIAIAHLYMIQNNKS